VSEQRRPSLEDTEIDEEAVGAETAGPIDPSNMNLGPAQVAPLDAEHLRSSVAAHLFGAAAEPAKIGRFTVLQRLGAGAMGVVYSAYDTQLDRKIAIKLLRGVDEEGAHHARLTREAQALAKLSHPHVVQVFELGTFRSQVFVAMEFVEGQTLREWSPGSNSSSTKANPNPNPLLEILAVFVQAGEGLAAAHRAGLVHRDFKPDNVLVGDDGRVRVLDFGLARGTSEPRPSADVRTLEDEVAALGATNDSLSEPLTRTGAILGTPAYMAPEQFLAQGVDARSDQFAFCVALWEKLYGERPFAAADFRQLALAVTAGVIREPSGARVPQHLRRVLERGLSVDPDARWPDMDSLLEALTHDPRTRRRRIGAGVIAGIAALSVGAGVLLHDPGPGPCEGGERELSGVWDPQIRGRVQTAFEATGAPYADEAWRGTAPQLDAFAEDWVTMHREVCEASVVRRQESPELFGRKMVCLGQRLTELEQLTRLLVEADADVVSRAIVAAGSLETVASCADERALLDAPVDDERMRDLEHLLASASGRKIVGKYEQGATIAKLAIDLARDIGTAHGEGRALLLLGEIQAKRRELPEAKTTLREALRRADVAGDDATRVQALTQLMRVSFLEHDLKTGESLAADARAALERLGSAPLLEADFYLHYGSLVRAGGDNESASEYQRRALEIRARQLGADHPEVAIAMANISNALTGAGQHEAAESYARKALAIFETKLGASHPNTAASHNNIGNSLLERGRKLSWARPEAAAPLFVEAAEHYAEAVRIREAILGEDHPSVALNLHNLGEAQRLRGDFEGARATLARSLEIKREHLGEDHPSVTMTMTGLGRVLLALEIDATALELLERAAEQRRTRPGSDEAEAETFFALALAELACAPETGSEREAALTRADLSAERARDSYQKAGDDYRGEYDEVRAWLAAHPRDAPSDP